MKKATVLLAIALIVLLSFSSCKASGDVCYYGYFGQEAVLLLYSSSKNTLYEVNVPTDCIALWGRANGIDGMSASMLSYVGLREDGFMKGNAQVFAAVQDILDALTPSKEHSPETRLEVLVTRQELLKNSELIENMNRLCGTDFSALIHAIEGKSVEVRYFDIAPYLRNEDIYYSKDYFSRWLAHVLGEQR